MLLSRGLSQSVSHLNTTNILLYIKRALFINAMSKRTPVQIHRNGKYVCIKALFPDYKRNHRAHLSLIAKRSV